MIGIGIRREPIRPPMPPPAPLDHVMATLARDGVRPTRAAILQAAIAEGYDPEFCSVLAHRAGGLDGFGASAPGPL